MEPNKELVLHVHSMDNVTAFTKEYIVNNSSNDTSYEDGEIINSITIFVVGCFLFIFGVVGNITTAFVIFCDRKLHNATYTVIALLAITDLLAICARFATFMMSVQMLNLDFIIAYGNPFLIGNFVTLNSSNFVIVILARLRYRLLVFPLHTANITTRRVEIQCILAWVASLILAIPYGCNLILNQDETASYIVEFIWTFYLYLSTIIPIMTYHCLKVRNIRGTMASSQNITNKMATMVAVILSLQVLSLLPLFVGHLIILIYMDLGMGSIVQCGMLLNHTINPVVFFMFAKLNNCMRKKDRQKESLQLTYSCNTNSEMV